MTRPNLSTLRRYQGVSQLSARALEDLLQLVVDACGAARCVAGFLDDGGALFRTTIGVPPADIYRFVPIWLYAIAGGPAAVRDVREVDVLAVIPELGARSFLAVIIPGGGGRPAGVVCVCDDAPRDFTEREERVARAAARQIAAQMELGATLDRLRERHLIHLDALETLNGVLRAATTVAIVTTDRAGIITQFNAGAERIFAARAGRVVGRASAASLFSPEEIAARGRELGPTFGPLEGFEVLAAPCRTAGPIEQEWALQSNPEAYVSVVAAPLQDEDGVLTGYVLLGRDVTERRAMARLRDEFISTTSHELRTPLTALLGALDLAAGGVGGALPEGVAELVGIAQDNGRRLLRLVNDILDVQKLDAGVFELSLAPCDLGAVVTRAVDLARPLCAPRDLSLTVRAPPAPLVATGDFDRLVQVALNLISNAVKFSPNGGEVTVTVTDHDGRGRISVADQGPGIPLDFRDRIFTRFAQASSKSTRGGTGLGLSIVRSLVELHRGRVWFDSTPGEGATFHVELPRG